MRFCPVCENMLYISIRSDGAGDVGAEGADGGDRDTSLKLTYSCKHCGFSTPASELRRRDGGADDPSVVLSTDYSDDQTSYKQFATPYISHDPTLPRVNDIVCPSDSCTKPPDAANEVIFVKYDPVNLKYLYHCMHCSVFWKTGGGLVGNAPAPPPGTSSEE